MLVPVFTGRDTEDGIGAEDKATLGDTWTAVAEDEPMPDRKKVVSCQKN
jgi:hypothetical protein